MTPEEALEIHYTYTVGKCGSVEKQKYIEAIRVAFAMLEKQVAQEPYRPWDMLDDGCVCPTCISLVYKSQKYCDECGQKLKRGEGE